MTGLGALADLGFDHLDLVVGYDAGELMGIERTVAVAAAEIAGADFPNQVAAILAVIWADAAFPGVMGEAFSARTALGLSAPKLIAEMLKIEAEYGFLQSGPPMTMRNFSSACGLGAIEWCIRW